MWNSNIWLCLRAPQERIITSYGTQVSSPSASFGEEIVSMADGGDSLESTKRPWLQQGTVRGAYTVGFASLGPLFVYALVLFYIAGALIPEVSLSISPFVSFLLAFYNEAS